nr:RHS repeat-associated core domain-containing protein [Oceanobacter mangrovi]
MRNHQNTVINERKYQYNATGQISQIDDQLRGSTQYRYDNIERLIQVTGPQPEQFVHDPAGNLLGSPEDVDTAAAGSDTKTPQVSGNRLNFQGDRHYAYDAQGNRIEQRRGKDGKQVTCYQYDHQNRLIGIEQKNGSKPDSEKQRTEYQYDALGRRIRKIHKDANQQTIGGTEFYWNDDVLLTEQALVTSFEVSNDSEEQAEQQPNRHYVFEPNSFKPLAFVQHEQLHYYHLDHLGTPQEITNASGELVWTAQYKAYGSLVLAPIRQVENNLRFQGQYFDEESGLHYNRFRYYDPECGRFINQDPIGLLGGNNNYLYVPNPVGWVDPWGLSAKNDCDKRRRRRANRESLTVINGKEVRGFRNAGELLERAGYLKNRLAELGIDDVQIGIRGSSVSGRSSKGGSYRVERGELKASDVDFFFTSEKLERKYSDYFTGDGRLKPDVMGGINPELQEILDEFSDLTSSQIGRKADAVLLKKSVLADENPESFVIVRE